MKNERKIKKKKEIERERKRQVERERERAHCQITNERQIEDTKLECEQTCFEFNL